MAKLTPADVVRERLNAAMDNSWWEQVHEEQRVVVGGSSRKSYATVAKVGGVQPYPDILAGTKEIGHAALTLRTGMVQMSRLMSNDPAPSFTGLDDVTAEVRIKLWQKRYRDLAFDMELEQAWHEGDMHGLGCLYHCMETDPVTGLDMSSVRYVPIVNVFIDPTVRNPRRSRWVAFGVMWPWDQAQRRFKGNVTEQMIVRAGLAGSNGGSIPMVPVVEYYDLGYGDGDPTYAAVLGGIDRNPGERKLSPAGASLPVSWFVGFLPSGVRRPLGRIALQRSMDEAVNACFRMIRDASTRGRPLRVWDPSKFDARDLKRYFNGEQGDVRVKVGGDLEKAVVNIDPVQISPMLLQMAQWFMGQFNEDAQQTTPDRGGQAKADATAYEVATLQNAAAQNRAKASTGTLRFALSAMEMFFEVARLYDQAPVRLNILGRPTLFNDPRQPLSYISTWLEDPAEMTVDRQSLTSLDAEGQMQRALARVITLTQYAQQLGIDAGKLREEFLKAMRITDPENWAMQAQGQAIGTGDLATAMQGQGATPTQSLQPEAAIAAATP